MLKIVLIGVGGFLGTLARYGLSGFVYRAWGAGFPYGTLVVNLIGCFGLALFNQWSEGRFLVDPTVRLFVAIGIFGGFTTFSTFGFETLEMLRDKDLLHAAINVVANVGMGLIAAWLGDVIGKLL